MRNGFDVLSGSDWLAAFARRCIKAAQESRMEEGQGRDAPDAASAELRAGDPADSMDLYGLDESDGEASESSPSAPVLDAGELAALLLLLEASRDHPGVLESLPGTAHAIVIGTPDASYAGSVGRLLKLGLLAAQWDQRKAAGRQPTSREAGAVLTIAIEADTRSANRKEEHRKIITALSGGRPVVGIAPEPDRFLPATLLDAADHRITLSPPMPELIDEVIFLVTGERMPCGLGAAACGGLTVDDLRLAIRQGSTGTDAVRRLRKAVRRHVERHRGAGPRLEDLHGMDQAKAWGLAVVEDLRLFRAGRIPWGDVDRGALVAGPPGTGKTTFARALATSCGCPLVSGSLAQWQAAGHLGDLLKAMRATFAEARKMAPCILLVDEVDSFGDRASFSHDNRDYSIQVVNGFLEELDGVQGREGVVVIGCCNDPTRLDSAIRRSGRLDRLLVIDLPDVEALAEILRLHLGPDALTGASLTAAATAAFGATGADIERWVRGARRRARLGRRDLDVEDLMVEIRDGAPPLSPAETWRAAVHEAGHALVARLLGFSIRRVSIHRVGANGGVTHFVPEDTTMPTLATLQRRMMVLMAGRAAEEIVLGAPSAGAGQTPDSDLAQATRLAIRIEAGGAVGSSLLWTPTPPDRDFGALLADRPDLRWGAAARLDSALAEARALLTLDQATLIRIAKALVDRKHLDTDDLEGLLGGPRATP